MKRKSIRLSDNKERRWEAGQMMIEKSNVIRESYCSGKIKLAS